jgi:drug/metabolite transporter (DMT)-like permease
MSPPSRQDLWSLHIAVFLFGLAGLFGKTVGGGAWLIVAGRTLFATVTLLLFAWLMHKPVRVSRSDWPRFALSGSLLAAHWWTFFHAVSVSSVAISLLGFASFPLFVMLLEPWVTGETVKARERCLILLVTAGLLLVVPEYQLRNSATQGLLWGVLSGLLFALLTLSNRKLSQYGPVRLALWQNIVAALWMAPLGWPALLHTTATEWWNLLLLGIVFTALAHGLFISSLRSVPARLAAVVVAMEPVYGILFAWLLFAEVPALRTLVGGAVILAASASASLRKQH